MKKIAVIVAIIILAVVVLLAIFVVATDNGPIFSDGDGDEYGNLIFITTPADIYTIPQKGPWYSIDISGTLDSATSVSSIVVSWHDGIDYGKQTLTPSSSWNTDMIIGRLSSGEHTLTARAIDSSGTILAQDYVVITIPEYYIYEWDSDNPTEEEQHDSYYYNFKLGLKGEVTRIKGEIHSSSDNLVWTNIWNGVTSQWTTVDKNTHTTTEGWKNIDITVNNVWASWVGFAGYSTHIVDGFKGEVWIKPGTINYQQSPLEIVISIFGGDSQDNQPHP